MARLFPSRLPRHVEDDPYRASECRVFRALERQLDDGYRVFHGVTWLSKNRGRAPRDCEADFVIAREGRGILVLEVKGGKIAFDGSRGRWTSRDRSGKVHELEDPVEQARRNKYGLRNKLASLPGAGGRGPFLGHAVAFPDCAGEGVVLTPELPREIVVYSEDLEWIDRKVESMLDFWSDDSGEKSRPDARTVRRLEQLLARDFELRTPLGTALREEGESILQLTEEQFHVLDILSSQPRVAVSGGAGTGKSILALEKARRLAAEGFRTLLTCFNRPLVEHLQRRVGEVEGLTVNTFHGMCEELAKQAGVPLPDYSGGGAPSEYFSDVLPAALMDALDRDPDLRFDAVVVDEGQDFEADWWERIELAQSDPGNSILYVFHDDNQNIYRKESALPKDLSPVNLPRNLRNTQSIHRFAMPFYEGTLQPAGPEGRPVELIEVLNESFEKPLSKVLHRLVNEESVAPGEIAVLSGRSIWSSPLGKLDRIGAFELSRDAAADDRKVVLESIYRFKGLQRRVVILVELEAVFSHTKLDKRQKEERIYTGITRAQGHLVVMGNAEVLRLVNRGDAKQ